MKQTYYLGLLLMSVLLFSSCEELKKLELNELGEINVDNKQITITGIPDIHDGKMLYMHLLLHDGENNYNYNSDSGIHGRGRIYDNSITVSLNTDYIDWIGFGSFYISFRIPFNQSNYAIVDNSNSELFMFTDGLFEIIKTDSIVNFSEFLKVGVNTQRKQITIINIPDIHNGKRLYLRFHDLASNSNFNSSSQIHGEGNITDNSVAFPLRHTTSSIPWTGVGSFYISIRIPFTKAIIGLPSDSNSELFTFTDGLFEIIETDSIVNFSDFSKVD